MPKLTGDQQAFVVQEIAMFSKYTEIQTSLKNNYGIDIKLSQIGNYDPSKAYFKGAKKWTDLFETTREDFLKSTSKIAIAHTSYRLKKLQDRLDAQLSNAPNMQNNSLILEILQQAAKESGGMFTNRLELTGKNGKPLIPEQMASILYKDLVEKEKWNPQEAAKFAADYYKVDETKVLNG